MEYRFFLTYSGTTTQVDEPDGWADFKSEIKRDFQSHGSVYMFTSGSLKLGFDGGGDGFGDGRAILEEAFQNYGLDAEVTFTADWKPTESSDWENLFTGDAVMSNREYDLDYFQVDFETSSLKQKINNRLKTKVNIDATQDLDGNALIGTINKQTEDWDDIVLERVWMAEFLADDFANRVIVLNETKSYNTAATSHDYYHSWGYEVTKFNSFNEVLLDKGGGKDSKATETDYADQSDDASVDPLLVCNVAGTLTIDLSIALEVTLFGRNISVAADIDLEYDLVMKQFRKGLGGSLSLIATKNLNNDTHTLVGQSIDYSYTFTEFSSNSISEEFTVQKGDYIFLTVETSQSSTSSFETQSTVELFDSNSLQTWRSEIDVRLRPDVVSRTVDFYLVHDLMSWISYIISGDSGSFYSEFFGRVEHGYDSDGCGSLNALTTGGQLRGVDVTPSISLQDCLDWASARYGVGWGYERYEYGYRLRVEPMEFFYQDVEILDIGDNINEQNTYKETHAEELNFSRVEIGYAKSSDAELINNDFSDFLTKAEYSLPIKSIEGTYSKISPFIASNDLIQATYEQDVTPGKAWKYDNEIFVIALVEEYAVYVPENKENFVTITGVYEPFEMYNYRHSPAYMMLEHAVFINSILMGKGLMEEIQNTSNTINQSFRSRYGVAAPCKLGDIQRQVRGSLRNIEIGNNFVGQRLWKPIKHSLTVALSKAQLDTITDDMEGYGANPYGYLTYRDDEGNTKQGYPLNITWNPIDEIAEIETIEKAGDYEL